MSSKQGKLFVGLGSNLGDRYHNLHRAIEALDDLHSVTDQSTVRSTAPHQIDSSRYFLNQVIRLYPSNSPSPGKLLESLLEIESTLGRDRSTPGPDRIIDIDLLYWGRRTHEEEPILPHPRITERRFVLEPMVELAPDFIHPQLQLSQQQLLNRLENKQ